MDFPVSSEDGQQLDQPQPPVKIIHHILHKGSKTFWKTRTNLDVVIVHHLKHDCLELIAYNSPTESEAPRLYLKYSEVLLKLNLREINEQLSKEKALLMHSYSDYNENDLLKTITNKAVVNYVLSRINMEGGLPNNSSKIFLQPSFDDKVIYITNKIDVEMTKPDDMDPYYIARKSHTTFANFNSLMDEVIEEHQQFRAEITQASNFMDVSRTTLAVEQNMGDKINNDVLLFGVQKASLVAITSENDDVPVHNTHRHLHARHSLSNGGSSTMEGGSSNADLYRASHVESGPITPLSSRLSHILHLPVDPARIEAANRLYNAGRVQHSQPQPPRQSSPSPAKVRRRSSVSNARPRRQSDALHYMKPIDHESEESGKNSPSTRKTAMAERRRASALLPVKSPRDPYVSPTKSPRDPPLSGRNTTHGLSLHTVSEYSPRCNSNSSTRPLTEDSGQLLLPQDHIHSLSIVLTPSPPPGGPRNHSNSVLSLNSLADSSSSSEDEDGDAILVHTTPVKRQSTPSVVPPIDLSHRRLSESRSDSRSEPETTPRFAVPETSSPRLTERETQGSHLQVDIAQSSGVTLPALTATTSHDRAATHSVNGRDSGRQGLVPAYFMNQLLSRSTDTWNSYDSPQRSASDDRSPYDRGGRDESVRVDLKAHSFDVDGDAELIDGQINAIIRPVNALDLLQHTSDMWVNSYNENRSRGPSPPVVKKSQSCDERPSNHMYTQREYYRSPSGQKLSPQHTDSNRQSNTSLHASSVDPTMKTVDLNAQFSSMSVSSRDSAAYHGRKLLASSGNAGMGRVQTPERTADGTRRGRASFPTVNSLFNSPRKGEAPVPSLTQLPRTLNGSGGGTSTSRSSSPQVSPATTGRSANTATTALTSGTALSLSMGICDLKLPSTAATVQLVSPDRHNTTRSNPSRNSTAAGGVFNSPLLVNTAVSPQGNKSNHQAMLQKLSPSKATHNVYSK